ncbi:MAG: hypothetical protein Q8O88_03585 [bacterium]|nr:hypothetical protein [bacterium]
MKTKKTNKNDSKESIRKAYEVAIAEETLSGVEDTQYENHHRGLLPVFIFIEGDVRDTHFICLN